MSNYNVGDMIRLTRQAIGMSQEELCDNICSVQTLSRIENGKVKVKKKVYQQLMEKMGRDGTKNYSVLSTENFDVLDMMVEVDNAIFRHDYLEAEKKLKVLKAALSMDEDINYLYIKECEIIIDGNRHRITKEKMLEELECLISYTITDYKQFLYKVYPFMRREIILLMNIGNIYGDLGQKQMAIDIYYMLIRSMNMGYMRQEDSIQLTVMLINNIAHDYGAMKQRDRAICMCQNAILKAKKYSLYSVLPKCYGDIAWYMMRQIKDGERDEADKELCRQYLRQAYAIANLTKQNRHADVTKDVYMKFFGESIYGCVCLSKGVSSGSSPYN